MDVFTDIQLHCYGFKKISLSAEISDNSSLYLSGLLHLLRERFLLLRTDGETYKLLLIDCWKTVVYCYWKHQTGTTAYPSGAHEFIPGFYWGSCYSIFSFMCMFCRSLFVLLSFSWPFCFLSFDLRLFSYIQNENKFNNIFKNYIETSEGCATGQRLSTSTVRVGNVG